MKHVLAVAMVAAASLSVPVVGAAQSAGHHDDSITLAQWTAKVEKQLAERVEFPRGFAGRAFRPGVVRVKFNCSDTGRADKVSLAESSGDRRYDAAALQAVKQIATLHPLAKGMKANQPYTASILFHPDGGRDHDTRMAAVRADAAKRNAWFDAPRAERSAKTLTAAR